MGLGLLALGTITERLFDVEYLFGMEYVCPYGKSNSLCSSEIKEETNVKIFPQGTIFTRSLGTDLSKQCRPRSDAAFCTI